MQRLTCEAVLSESFSASHTSGTTADDQNSAFVASIALDHLLGALGGLDFVGIARNNNVLANDFNLLNIPSITLENSVKINS